MGTVAVKLESQLRINRIVSSLRIILNEADLHYDVASPLLGVKGLPAPRTDVEPLSLVEVQFSLATVQPDFKKC